MQSINLKTENDLNLWFFYIQLCTNVNDKDMLIFNVE